MSRSLPLLLALALAACDLSTTETPVSSDAPPPNSVSITETSITDDQVTVSWSASGPEPAEHWRLYQNNLLVCSADLDLELSSSDASGNYQQSDTCTLTLEDGENSIYVQLCNISENSTSTCSTSAIKQIFYAAADPTPGAISWQDLPSSTSATTISATWLKADGGNGDYWFVYHDGAQACTGNLSYVEDYVAQSADCTINLAEGVNQLQAELCSDQPAGIQDLCSQSEVASVTLVLDPAKELATPILATLDEGNHYAGIDTNISWHKDTSSGSAGDAWSLYHNGTVVCQAQLAAEATSASCTIQLVEGDNALQVELCTDITTYSGASCTQSATLAVSALDPEPITPGLIHIANVSTTLAETSDSVAPLEWLIDIGSGVQHWSVDLNGAEYCVTSSTSEYYQEGSCLLNLVVGINTISVRGCNYGYDDVAACSTSEAITTERVALPGTPELTSSLPTTTYAAEHNLSWERTTGASAERWLAFVDGDIESDQCHTELNPQTPQGDSCIVELGSGINEVLVRLCVDSSTAAYCVDSASLYTELLAPIPGTPEISTASQSIADDSIELEWSKSSGEHGSYWLARNNDAEVAACADQPLLSAGDGQSGSCDLPLAVGENIVSVRLCNDNNAGTASCADSTTISITRLVASPEFTSATSVSTAENSVAVFYTATVEDNDSSAEQISFALSGGADVDFFQLDSASGALAFRTPVDYEIPQDSDSDNVYQVALTATDELNGSAQLELAVSLSNSNDNLPILTTPPASLTVAENDSSVIYTFTASDLDGDALIYSLDGADAQHLTLGAASGTLQFQSAPDYETPLDANQDNVYELNISVSDGEYHSSALLSVVVNDSNDEVPQATSASSVALAIDSLVVGATIYTVTATDTDLGDQITYTLGGADQQHFTLGTSSGELTFSQLPTSLDDPQDANGDNIYEVLITLTDLGANSSELNLSVSVVAFLGSIPEFAAASASVGFDENAVGVVYTAQATDADEEVLSYSIAGDDAEHFTIDTTSGALEFTSPPDYEQPTDSDSDNIYDLAISATDPVGNQAQQSLTVSINNLNDNAPQFASSSAELSISENNTSITTITASDADADTLTYAITASADSELFTIDPASGALAFISAPNYESPQDANADNVYQLAITATDGAYSASQDLTITVADVNEAPTFTEPSVALTTAENNSSFIYTVAAAIDEDQDQQLTYQLSGADASAFDLDATTRALSFKTTPDFDSPTDQDADNSYQIAITAADTEYSASQDIVIAVADLNDETPQFTSPSTQSVDYSTAEVGAIIYTAQATDADATDQITYALGGADSGHFSFDPSSGALAFFQLPALADFPEDGSITYLLSITATDLAANSSTLDLSVSLLDDTGSAPTFAQASVSIAVDENSADTVYSAQASDVDSGDILSYSISGSDADSFTINSSSGALAFQQAPDFENPADDNSDNTYELTITVTDSMAKQAQQSLSITVNNLNDNSPQFTLSSSAFSVSENSSGVASISASDADGDDLTFSLTNTSDANLFTLDPSSGALAFAQAPDFETPLDSDGDNVYQLSLSAFDGANTATQAITVSVANIDEAPSFAAATQDLSISENSSGSLYTAQATDPEGATLTYSASGTDASLFTLDPTSGALAFNSPPNYEQPSDADADNTYQLSITASDGANQATQAVAITVADVNEAPSFTEASVALATAENNTSFIYTVAAAIDEDQGQQLTYQLSGTDAAAFNFDAATRTLSFQQSPDFEAAKDQDADNVYQLSVVASDGEYDASQSITITVADLNDEAPRFTSLGSQVVDYTQVEVGDVIYTATATDADANDQITYALSGADASTFTLDSASGALAFAQLPPLEQFPEDSGITYQLVIAAADLAANSSSLELSVSLLDDTGSAPEFAEASGSIAVDENIATTIYTAQATDVDPDDTLSYSLGGIDYQLFSIDAVSGALTFNSPPDHEQPLDDGGDNVYDLAIVVTDSPVGNQAQQSLTVSVTNLNDNQPQFALASTSFDVAENSTAITTVAASDADGDDLTFSLTNSTDSSLFDIDPTSGALAFTSAPDYENPADGNADNTYELTLSVFDGAHTISQAITVSVSNIDEVPSFASATVDLPVNENTSGAVYQAQATDPEQATLAYSISGADASRFNLDASSGDLAFKNPPNFEVPLDQDANNVYELSISAADGANQVSQAVTITVADVNEAPSFTTTSVALNTAENNLSFTHVVDAATDEDSGEQLTYQLSGADQSAFDFDAATRVLSFKTTPDYENPADQDSNNVYQINIVASDSEYDAAQAITIVVADLNDEAPQFTSASTQSVDYSTAQVSAIVYTAQATDADAGDQITYALGGADAANFDFDSSSGELSFNQLPELEDFPAEGSIDYALSITATDLGANSSDLALTISLLDDTGSAPTFASASASINVDENTASTVYTAQATDVDVGDALTYSISGTDSSLFTIDPSSGDLSFNTAPDFETPADSGGDNIYDLSITATDSVGKQAQQSLAISVNNLNDNPPQFALASSAFDVLENSTAIATIAASDPDGDDLTLALIASADSNFFTLDPASGALAFISAPDFETPQDANADNTYELELSVADGDYTTTQAITISVANIDEAPSFAAATVDLPVNENSSGSIYTAQATDPEGAALTYSASGADASLFTLDDSSGDLTFKTEPNFEKPLDQGADNTYNLTITASDGTNQASQAVTVTVADVNEPPTFASASVNLNTDENDLSFAHIVDAADDPDQGEQLTYQLGGDDATAFDFDTNTRALSFKATPDYESPQDQDSNNVYQIAITAADSQYSTSQAINIAVADLNDEAPQFTSASSLALDYTSVVVGTTVYTAQATDADANDQITYALSGADADHFSFNASSGELAFSELPSLENPKDANIDNVYELTITATDLANNSTDLALSINVVDDTGSAPTFAQASASIAVDENTASTVYTAQATDVDPGDILTYSIAGTDSSLFTIDPSSGDLSFNTAPDYENPADSGGNNTYELSIAATDAIGKQASQSLTITVNNLNDNPPQFALSANSFDVAENSTAVTAIAASDADGDDLTFSLTNSADASFFTLDPTSGVLAFVSAPDFENPADDNTDNTYELELSVADVSHTTTQEITITVTNVDEAPSFAAATVDLPINENTSGSIYTAAATDPEQATLTYSASGTDAGLFDLDSASGELTFKQSPNFEQPTDQDSNNVYQLDISASDGANQASQAVTVTVTNVNEAPAFASTSVNLDIDENDVSFAHTVDAATDPDQGETLTYALGGDDAADFDFDPATRALSFKQSPNYEQATDQNTDNVYQITITASDSQYSTSQAITIAVADLNDEAPQFTSATSLALDYTSVAVGATVYTAQATDADANDQVSYTLGGADASAFSLDNSSGALAFAQAPSLENPKDADKDNVYQLTITATDLNANSTDLTLSVNVVDDTGSAPTFAQASVSIDVDENSPGTIYTAQATDVDPGDILTYSISGTDSSHFTIDPSSGDLSFNLSPDYENPTDNDADNTYELAITATDSMAKQAQQSLSIAVNNLNDNPPQFALSSSTFSVPENTTAITTITATDVDGDDDFTFSLTSTTDSNLFTIDPASGALSFNQAPDFETPQDSNADNTYELELSVADGAYTTSATISVSVTNVNDVAPSFAATTDSSSVSENTSGVVYTASATDIEGDSVSYSLAGTDSTHFTIDSSNGELSLTNALDFENPADHNSNNDYELEITASDGTNSASLALTISVQDLNDNTPSFTPASDSIQIAENTSGTVYTAAATDLDATDTITYSLSGTDSSYFTIDPTSGALAFINSPDYENPQDQNGDNFYELSITATDTGNNSNQLALTIEILDTSEQPPEISQIIGGDQAIDFTFDDFGTSEQLSIYRFTDDACSTADLASDHTQCYTSDDTSSDTAKIDFSGALSSADYQVSDSGLRAGQRYYYQIWAAESSSASDIGVWSQRYSAMTWPAADVGTTLGYDASETLGTQVVLSFVAPSSGDDDYYHFLRHSDPDCASYAAGTALNRADYSDWSALVDPVNGGLCSGLTELTLSSTNLHAPSGGASDSHTDSGLARGTTYYYLLRTVNYSGANGVDFSTRSGASATSNQLQWTTVPPAPAADDLEILSSPAVAADQISIAFASVAGASSYKLVRYIPANCSVADQQIASVESCSASDGYAEQDFNSAQSSYTDSGLQAGTTYAYQYRAINAAGSSQYSPAVSATTTFDKPSISAVSSVSLADANVISVSWSASSGIDSYSVLGSSNESCLISATASADPQASAANCDHSISASAASSATSIDIDQLDDGSALASGSYYYFAAAAVSSSGSSDYSDVASAITAPASPNVISLSPGYQQVEVAWDVPAGSAENVLYRYTESACSLSSFPSNCGLDTGSYTFTNSIPNDAYIDDNSGNGLVDNQMYYYALQASNAGGARYTESASAPVVLTAPKTPDSLIASGERLAVQLRWGSSPTDADDGVAGYEILRSSSSTCYGSAISAYSDYASCPDAALFLFDYGSGEDQNEYQFSDSELDPSSGSEPLTGGSTYYYWIRSFYGSASDAVYSASTSAPASATPILPAPTNLAVDAELSGSSTDISIAWDEVATATSYVLYRTTSADCLTIVNRNTSEAQNDCADYQREELSGSSTTATTHSDLPSDTIYYYYVAAANSAVEGELSSALSTRSATVAPTITSTQTYSNTVVRVEWDASSAYDATYHLYAYSGDSSCNPFTTECPHESLTTFTADGSSDYYNYAQQLEPGTHYNFKMLAITEYEQEDGTEDFVHGAISSAAATATTAANHPTITGHEYVDYNYFDLFVSIEGGLDSVLYWVLYTLDANCSVNDVIAGQCAVGGQLGTAEPASSIRLANYDFGVYYYVLSLNSEDYSLLSPDEDTPPYLVPARPAQVELSVNATKNSSGNGTDIKIEWQQSSGVDGYVLYRTTSSGCITDSNRNDSSTKSNCDDYQRQEISGSSTTTTTHSNLPNDTIYHYSVATISNGSEGTLSESIATHTATTAPPIVDVITYNQSQIEVTWWATSAFETDYYIYAYSGDASCDPHAEVCPGEKLVSVAFDFSAEYTTVFTGLTPGTRYNFKAYSNVAYPQENGGTDYIVGYISETAEAKTNYTFANHPIITGHQENDDGDILLEFAIDGGTDDLTYYIFRTTNGECTITEVYNADSECTDRGTATATPEQNVVIHKVDDNDYYYHVISANPVGPLAWDDSTEPYYIPSYVVVKDIDVEMTHLVANSNSDFITINFVAAEPIPADNKWTVRFYPALIENSEVREHVFTDEQVTEDLALAFQINAKYYFHPHRFELYASRLDDTDFILLASFIVWDVQPPPLVAVEKNADSNKYSEEKDFDIYIQNYNGDFDVSSVVGIETLEADITMIFTDADAALCRPPLVPIVDMIYGNCPLVRSYTDWWDGSELLFNRVEGDTGNQLLHDVVVSNNETYQASQGLFQVYDITFAGTTPIYDDQDDPWSFFVGPYISSFTIDTDFGKYSLDYEEAFSYLSIELAFEEDDMAEFKVYGSSSSASLLPTPTLVLSPALLSQGLSAGSAYNSWDLHLLWEAINGINSYAIHEYSDSDCAYLLSAPELCGNYNLHSSLSPDFSHAFAAADMGSYFYYRLQAYDAAGNSSELGEQIAVHIPQALNDSGVDICVVSDALSGAQDCASGRDANVAASAKVGSGSAGFDFSLLEPDTNSDSLCVHDNTTGLSWSSWSVPADDLASAADPDTETNATRSSATFAELATITLDACGYSGWSLPSIHELLSIADYNQTEAKIDQGFFTDFNSSQPSYWSASGHILDFSSGDISLEANASAAHSVLLVRGDRRWGHDFGAERFQLVEHIDDGNTSIHLVYDNHSQLHYAPCLAGQSYDPVNHSCTGTPTELDYIDSLNAYDSNSTWRQPNIKELIAILDPTHNLLPNPTYFPNPTSNSTSDPNSSTDSDSTSDSSTDSTSDTASDSSTNPDSSTGSGSNSSTDFSTDTVSDSSTDSSSDYSSDIDSDFPYPAPIFILTPSSQSSDHITGRQLNPTTQSTTPTTSFSTLNSYLIYQAPMEDSTATE